jgi:hypothetical protein
MIRKQIYIDERQDKALRNAARLAGMSQAEVIRNGIRRGLSDIFESKSGGDIAWRRALKFMMDRSAAKGVRATKRTWTRDELYDR